MGPALQGVVRKGWMWASAPYGRDVEDAVPYERDVEDAVPYGRDIEGGVPYGGVRVSAALERKGGENGDLYRDTQ